MEMIRAADMLKEMDRWESSGNHLPFSITFVTCNQKKNTGGEKITIKQAVIVGSGTSKSSKRNPNHYENYTRNIMDLSTERIYKIHVLLVTRFNGKSITL